MSSFDRQHDPNLEPLPVATLASRSYASALTLAAGLAWIVFGVEGGVLALFLAAIPGSILISAGVAGFFWPSEERVAQMASFGAAIALAAVLPQLLLLGFGPTLFAAALSMAAFIATGTVALRQLPRVPEVPDPVASLGLGAKVALDDALFGSVGLFAGPLVDDDLRRSGAELDGLIEYFDSMGWIEKPEEFHRRPPPLDTPRFRNERVLGIEYEHLSFESEYEPSEVEPGRDRWLSRTANREGHAYVLRHPGQPRPWMVCINGAGTGYPITDVPSFKKAYHERFGLNLLIPVLPLHGPRRISMIPRQFSDVAEIIHLEAQAMWDIRRLISWIRAEGGTKIGVGGLSLGGYTTALLTTLESNLECAIAGIPPSDFGKLMFRHLDRSTVRAYGAVGLDEGRVGTALRVVSPLAVPTLLSADRLAIFAGIADQIVPPDQVRALAEHWGEPRCEWYQGGHLSFAREPVVADLVRSTLDSAGMLD